MNQALFVFFSVLVSLGVLGCARITAQVVEKPRVDQELSGNRGYLAGSAPAPASRKTTRQMIQTDIELPTTEELNPWKIQKKSPHAAPPAPPAARAPIYPMESPQPAQWQEREVPPEHPRAPKPATVEPIPQPAQTYVVQKGDTLEKIASKFYGDSNQWRRIYKANREKLSSPNRIYAGQKLSIPPAAAEGTRPARRENDLK